MGLYAPGRPTEYQPETKKGAEPPAKPGEYRILSRGGGKSSRDIHYVGETNNLKRRMEEHRRSGKFSDSQIIAYKTADESSNSQSRRIHEQHKIRQHTPPENKSKGGEGRIAK
jgi:hypothetical protein